MSVRNSFRSLVLAGKKGRLSVQLKAMFCRSVTRFRLQAPLLILDETSSVFSIVELVERHLL